jgi:hypothetical protein
LYLDLEWRKDRAKLAEPALFLRNFGAWRDLAPPGAICRVSPCQVLGGRDSASKTNI